MLRQIDLPRAIDVRGHVWTVHFYRKPPMTEKPGEEIFGVCMPRKRRIYIKQGQAAVDRFSTLVHEILHAIEYEYEIEIPHEMVNRLEGPIADCLLAFCRDRGPKKRPKRHRSRRRGSSKQ